MNDEPYRHKEPTVLVEMKLMDVINLLNFFMDVEKIEKDTSSTVRLDWNYEICNSSIKWLEEKYGMGWDLVYTSVDFSCLIENLRKTLDEQSPKK